MTDTPPTSPAPSSDAPPAAAPAAAPPVPAPSNSRRVMWGVVLVAMALVGVGLILHAWRLPPFSGGPQTTDNAYVRGQVTIISPQVSGSVTSVKVQDFQSVKQGQLLATVDDRIYRQRLEQAQADLHAAQAALANSAQSQASARGSVAQTQASIAAAQSAVTKARADANRVQTLFQGGWVAQAQVDVAQNALRASEARLAEARATEEVARTGVTSAVVGRGSLEASVENASAKVRLAQIDLDNARILAPRDGRLGEVTVRQGQLVSVGTQLMALVPDVIWINANMKETQMRDVRVGQPVEITVDALGGRVLKGKVER
ncbi:HlyD family secretion protein, partial [Brevundimonas sp.]